jgi:hypothetical protein
VGDSNPRSRCQSGATSGRAVRLAVAAQPYPRYDTPVSARLLGLALLCSAVVAAAAPAATVTLNVVQFPKERTLLLKMRGTDAAPKAELTAVVRFESDWTVVDLLYYDMKPAALFGGDVTCYVAWAVSPEGSAAPLGEMVVRSADAEIALPTRQRAFALMVTAELYPMVTRPSELVVWTSPPSGERRAPSSQLAFSGLAPAPAHAVDSIATVPLDRGVPAELLQARATRELARRLGAAELAPRPFADAGTALAKAESSARHKSEAKETSELARRSIEASNEAIRSCIVMPAGRQAAAPAAVAAATQAQPAKAEKAEEAGTEAEKRHEGEHAPEPAAPPPTPAVANIRVDDPTGDQVTAVVAGGVVGLRVQRVQGFGGATLTLTAGEWPRSLRLELVDFPGLDLLVVCRGTLCLETDPERAPAVTVREGELDRSSLEKLRIPIRAAPGSITVELPAAELAHGAPALALRWFEPFRG